MIKQSTTSLGIMILWAVPPAILAGWLGYSMPFGVGIALLLVPWLVVLPLLGKRLKRPDQKRMFLIRALAFDGFLLPGIALGIYSWQTAPGKPLILPIHLMPGIFAPPAIPSMPKVSILGSGMPSIAQVARAHPGQGLAAPAQGASTPSQGLPPPSISQEKNVFAVQHTLLGPSTAQINGIGIPGVHFQPAPKQTGILLIPGSNGKAP